MQEIIKCREQLEKAIKDGEFDKALECLKNAKNFKITKDLLKSTDIGKSVGKLRAHKDIGISSQSKELIDKWKQDIEGTSATTTSSSSSSSSSTTSTTTTKTASPSESLKRKSISEDTSDRPTSKPLLQENKKISPPTTPKTSSPPIASLIAPITGANADLRNKTIQLFVEALTTDNDETMSPPEDIAVEIEAEMYDIYRGVSKEYKEKLRSFKFNLKKNDILRLSLLNRQISVAKFCSMDIYSMASDDLKEERKKLDKFNTEASMLGQNNEATTDQFQCGKCKQRKCTYTQLQTRSADEPPTTFVKCCVKGCGNRWRFC
ncbi:RNA polymerase II elongation factor [Dictyostelium discoideum AX4]|uniref:Transcription elongation factor A protein 1 n=1 Tax=Dictyostelium discoideum TaxID=44689 RepID=TCEA1_DICDI|nr:RNA polymerase II elongation factor [Dictyostelium discoideum AX4]Q54YG9.1 RecName: Full=Transcription elongation factor A protein 1; AltName: Full=Transcription elongation factor S-II protein 1; AltName: Full=Transcription elongation factor tf2s [Dictyostelium discoideum]EAL68293.1 RNA polymerase II elongation factor [Dictyostelium discoideum AX4]|eukprot:XP_642233.1 RNA polymerase II elongation factor [Dictyostelium discoideum AX4]